MCIRDRLLTIPGVMLNDSQDRVYPLGAAAGHLTGYVQAVTAEDLEKLENKGYHANSVIGRSGLEQAYEEELRPVDGTRIIIADETGNTIETLAYQPAQNGKDVRVTIAVSYTHLDVYKRQVLTWENKSVWNWSV